MHRLRTGLRALLPAVALAVLGGCVVPQGPPPDPASETTYRFPVDGPASYRSSPSHHDYPATDVFADCGTPLVAPTNGVVRAVRTVDLWDARTDNPAHRGGRYVAVVGDDGVRYYLAHLDTVAVAVGHRVRAGELVGTVGTSGRSSGCHLHLGLSPPCTAPEWSVRRGVVWPGPYLDAWREGQPRSPRSEILTWQTTWPTACVLAALQPHAAEA